MPDLHALPGGLIAFLLRPFPWQQGGGPSYDLAALEEGILSTLCTSWPPSAWSHFATGAT